MRVFPRAGTATGSSPKGGAGRLMCLGYRVPDACDGEDREGLLRLRLRPGFRLQILSFPPSRVGIAVRTFVYPILFTSCRPTAAADSFPLLLPFISRISTVWVKG